MALGWPSNMYRVGSECKGFEGSLSEEDIKEARSQIEPWLSALFQSEHLALLLGSRFTSSIGYLTKSSATGMGRVQSFGCKYQTELNAYAESSAKELCLKRRIPLLRGILQMISHQPRALNVEKYLRR